MIPVTCEIHAKGHRVYTFAARGGGIWNQITHPAALSVLMEERGLSERQAREALAKAQP